MRKLVIASLALAVPTLVLGALAACSSSSDTNPTNPTGTTTTTTPTGTTTTTSTATATSTATTGPLVNGCTTYADNTAAGVAAPGFNWGLTIESDPNHCSTIKAGQSVTWTGDFTSHPLAAHDDTDASLTGNPITSGTTSGQGTVTITFPTKGVYGYWCTVHQTGMQGVIQVE